MKIYVAACPISEWVIRRSGASNLRVRLFYFKRRQFEMEKYYSMPIAYEHRDSSTQEHAHCMFALRGNPPTPGNCINPAITGATLRAMALLPSRNLQESNAARRRFSDVRLWLLQRLVLP
jgi:hypothetical protein